MEKGGGREYWVNCRELELRGEGDFIDTLLLIMGEEERRS